MLPDSLLPAANSTPFDLALAVCHEVGNLVGAVRLHTHLIDEEMSPLDLARVTLEVDDLCARSAALLAHIRPLLSDPPAADEAVVPSELLASVRAVMTEQGGRDVRLDSPIPADLPAIDVDREVVHHLLQSLVFAALEATRTDGSVSLGAESAEGGVALVVVDDAAIDEDPADWRNQVARGRPLLLAVVDAIVGRRGGSLAVTHHDGRTRVSLVLPARPDLG
jgi:C4-dicarboxylate-specific signal transduction histidine kinase